MFENAFILNLIFYIVFGSIVAIFIFYFVKEIRIKKKRQKEWDTIKEFFRCKDEISVRRLYTSYISTIKRHWLLGHIYPDM